MDLDEATVHTYMFDWARMTAIYLMTIHGSN